jgi:nitrate/nitrite-specific signal transduction histidine kinase
VWDAIPMETVNLIIDSSPMRLLAVQALQGACLNGHREIIKELREEKRPGEIAADLETERTKIDRFISHIREFPIMLSDTVERGTLLKVCVIQSCRIVELLPLATLQATKVFDHYPRWCFLGIRVEAGQIEN